MRPPHCFRAATPPPSSTSTSIIDQRQGNVPRLAPRVRPIMQPHSGTHIANAKCRRTSILFRPCQLLEAIYEGTGCRLLCSTLATQIAQPIQHLRFANLNERTNVGTV